METITNNLSSTHATTQEAAPPPPASVPSSSAAPVGKARVAIYFLARDSDAILIVAIQRIILAMTGNPAFRSPEPKLADLIAEHQAFIAAVNSAMDSKIAIVVRNQLRERLTAMVRNLAHYVQVASGGDLAVLLSSGFPAQRGRQPVGLLPAPVNLRLSHGRISGQLIARCDKLHKAGAYDWRYASYATPEAWVDLESTFAASAAIGGLVPGMQYIVQVRARGTAGPSDWSDVAMLMAV